MKFLRRLLWGATKKGKKHHNKQGIFGFVLQPLPWLYQGCIRVGVFGVGGLRFGVIRFDGCVL